jgi:hydrogenase/urease accessory protein HupE
MLSIRIVWNRCRTCVYVVHAVKQKQPQSKGACQLMRPVIISLILLSVPLSALRAHDEKVSASQLQISKHEAIWDVDVGLLGLEKVMKFPAGPVELTEFQLQSMRDQIVQYLGDRLSVEINGHATTPAVGPLEPIYEPFMLTGEPHIARVRQEFRFHSAEEIKRLRLELRFFSELTTQHRAVVNVSWGNQIRQYTRVGPSRLELAPPESNPAFWSEASDFLFWGAHHIFIGYDHIAFLFALLLGARRLRETIFIVTSFTLAHSLTLLLAALDLIRVSQVLTESLIAASIVYVSIENYFLREGKHRWALTFFFGLVHGLGFSTVLRERLSNVSGIVVPVLSFNAGVELGQIAILLVAYPVLRWLRRGGDEGIRQARHRRLVWIGSAPILMLGLGWFVERVFGLRFMPI